MSTERQSKTERLLEKLSGGPLTIGKVLRAMRLGEEQTQAEFARLLKISRSHLNDIEKGNKAVSPERAARFAKILKHSEVFFVEIALQSALDQAGLKLKVAVRAS